jgi:hypothetical protein
MGGPESNELYDDGCVLNDSDEYNGMGRTEFVGRESTVSELHCSRSELA